MAKLGKREARNRILELERSLAWWRNSHSSLQTRCAGLEQGLTECRRHVGALEAALNAIEARLPKVAIVAAKRAHKKAMQPDANELAALRDLGYGGAA